MKNTMKKIMSIVLLFALLMAFSACSKKEEVQTPNSENSEGEALQQDKSPLETQKTVYDVLNELSKQQYQKVHLHINTHTGDIELNANYSLTKNEVVYSVEQMNLLPTNGMLNGASFEPKKTFEGTATIQNGTVIQFDGDEVTLPVYDELKGSFDFKESYFRNVQTEDGKFSAEVVSVSGFLGTDRQLSNMKIAVSYEETSLKKLVITYQTANSTVNTVYEFEK